MSFPSLSDYQIDELLGSSISTSQHDDVSEIENPLPTILRMEDMSKKSSLNDMSLVGNPKEWITRAIITIFPTDHDIKWIQPETYFADCDKILNIWVGQFEICPDTEKLHAHIYVEFDRKCRKQFSNLCNILKEIVGKHPNIRRPKRVSKDQRQGAVNYCSAVDKRMPDTECFFWPKNKMKVEFNQEHWDSRKDKQSSHFNQAKKEETEKQRLWIEDKPKHWTWDQVVHESEESKQLLATCSWGQKYHLGRHAETPRRTIKECIIFYGAGGTGKTTLAHKYDTKEDEDFHERYYRRNPDDGNFWGGGRTAYKGQRLVHFEEFCGQEPFHRIKEVCDIGKEGPSVNVKNGGAELNHEICMFTSNNHPAAWYRNLWTKEHKQFHPFWRRITQVWFFPANRPDGTLNIPDETNPPFYIDQTDDWISFKGNYQACLDHAQEHWPLPEMEFEFKEGIACSKFFNPSSN